MAGLKDKRGFIDKDRLDLSERQAVEYWMMRWGVTRDQLTAMGCVNAHLEDWGEFGMGWQQLNTWVRMTSPDTAVFIAQATPLRLAAYAISAYR